MFERARQFLRQMTQPASRHPEDRRSHPRLATEIQTVCRTVNDDEEHKAIIRNVSRSGINLLLETPLNPGVMLRIEVPHAKKSAHIVTLLACVTNVSPKSDDLWSTGCAFSIELSDDELAIFGGEKFENAEREQRAWVRHPVRTTAEFQVLPEENSKPRTADVVNLSVAGVGLLMDMCVDTGSVLSISLNRGMDRAPLSILASVVYLTDCSDGRWAAGCNFIRQLSSDELQAII